MTAFRTTQGRGNLFQLNFRNHRKIVIVDGRVAWVGGLNVGDEYLGLDPKMTPWRDTHMRLAGPAALGAQVAFLLDWCWATKELLDLSWDPVPSDTGDSQALLFYTGPSEERETAKLIFTHLINVACERIWIATPYFVPEPGVSAALRLAALRGVDIRVLVPKHNDSTFVRFASYYYMQDLSDLPIRFFQLPEGFMHQKVMLVDESLAVIGTHNFDNRSFLLNFEISALTHDKAFAGEVAAMLKADMDRAEAIAPAAFADRPFWFRFAMRAARLTAPIQ